MRYPRCGRLEDWTLKKHPSNPFVVKQLVSEKNRFTNKLAMSLEKYYQQMGKCFVCLFVF